MASRRRPATTTTVRNSLRSDPNAKPLVAKQLVGDWTAKREGGQTFDLDMKPDNTFTWKYSDGKRKSDLAGTYTVKNDLLVLEQTTGGGGAMIGRGVQNGDNSLTSSSSAPTRPTRGVVYEVAARAKTVFVVGEL